MDKTKKKKTLAIVISCLVVIVIAVVLYIAFGVIGTDSKTVYLQSEKVNANKNGSNVTVIDDSVGYQLVNGFGASACWWSQDVGAWDNADEIMQALYDDKKGIGLNIYRYNLGAGSKNDTHIKTENRRTECFLNADGTYNFNNDKNAQTCLELAKKYAGKDMRLTLFCNSAPVYLTKNGAAYGTPYKNENDPWISNLDKSKYPDFADFCYNSAEYFVNKGYRVTSVSPINEPQYSWAAWYNDDNTYSVNQEGCYYSKYEARDLLKTFVKKFKGSDLDKKGVKVSMFESGSMEGDDSSCAAYMDCILGRGPKYVFKNAKLRKYFNEVSMHSYWSSADTKKNAESYFSDKYSKYSIAATEYCQMTDDKNTGVYDLISKEKNGTNGTSIKYGVAMANTIIDDLTIMNASEWDWWTACSYGTYTDGLIYLDKDNHENLDFSKRYYCLGNFSKFIKEGATRIACSSGVENVKSAAFVNRDNSTVVVYVNNNDKKVSTTLDCTGKYAVYTTDRDNDIAKTNFGKAGKVNITLPATSVVTVVFE
ncbi:MAG: glycoside hydrolase family 30 protein [Eubacteriales bacterium]|nr:glycoside hydrolase family 30 protein [Eubacteriales bacterium]